MLAVPLPEDGAAPRSLPDGLSLAAVNGPGLCVVSGPADAVAALDGELAAARASRAAGCTPRTPSTRR